MRSIMFSSLPFPGQSGDKIISKVVTTAIAALFKQTGKLSANVRAEPVAKLLQGSIDGFDFISNGMLMYNGLRIEAMELYLEAVSIDFGAIFRSMVKLRQPTQATMRVVLTEEDLTTSFNTPFVVQKLQQLEYLGQSLHFENTQMRLNPDKSLGISTQIRVGDDSEPRQVEITAFLEVKERRKLQFVDAVYDGDIELGKALIHHVNNLLDLDKFAFQGSQLRIDRVRQRNQQIIFYGTARIEQFPSKG
ncbi:MAG: DUF2993 domain-containing protein [Prochloron sp. SP5CPC1]|nr:DUF2993 domain-containing protein [Candidatus Paraprochloron terpiosi SP5CPC1]